MEDDNGISNIVNQVPFVRDLIRFCCAINLDYGSQGLQKDVPHQSHGLRHSCFAPRNVWRPLCFQRDRFSIHVAFPWILRHPTPVFGERSKKAFSETITDYHRRTLRRDNLDEECVCTPFHQYVSNSSKTLRMLSKT